MIYPYFCQSCNHKFEVIKSVREIDNSEHCSLCGKPSERRIGRVSLMAVNDWTEHFNPALGQVIKNKAHQREVLRKLKDQGKELIEVGNEPVENIHKATENIVAEREKARWSEPAEKIIHDVLK